MIRPPAVRTAGLSRPVARDLFAARTVMVSGMIGMLVIDLPWWLALVLICTAATGVRISRHLAEDADVLPCLVDVLGMAVMTACMALGAATGGASGRHGGHAPVLVVTGVTAGVLWAIAAVHLRVDRKRALPLSSLLCAVSMAVMLVVHR